MRPKDYDVATSARPDDVCNTFSHRKTLQVGASFGVVTVVGGRRSGNVEIATFRRDDAYSDGRHPDRVSFSSAEEDARRRDFTINGIFFDPLENRVIDYVGGQEDLRNRIVRCIGDPNQRFAEDKLRLLRAIRMAATFEFQIDPATLAAMQKMASTITVVSAERIANEMRRLLSGSRLVRALELLHDSGLRPYLLPEFGGPADPASVAWTDAIGLCSRIDDQGFELGMAAILWPVSQQGGAQPIVDELASRWKLANRERDHIERLVSSESILRQADALPWSVVQPVVIQPLARDASKLARAVAKFLGQAESGIDFCEQRLADPIGELNPEPLVTGDDLLRQGLSPGPRLGTILAALRAKQLDGCLRNRQEALDLALQMWRDE
jgi:tRNA nucleotidyltransferase/poly(A) polymerase